MRYFISLALASMALSPAHAKERLSTVCQMIVDEQGRNLASEGKCDMRQSPASTFKVPLSLMGFDRGILKSAGEPRLPVKKEYNLALPEWNKPTDPLRWMRYSVVWYSQEIVAKLGQASVRDYLQKLNYGNRDMSGQKGSDPMKGFWIGSTLKISPAEQVGLMRKLLLGDLPVSKEAIEKTREIMDLGLQANGWRLYGKTGSGTPKDKNGKRFVEQTFGWFVGFAEKGDRKIAFAKLIQSPRKEKKSLGLMAKDQFMADYFGKNSPL